MHRNLIILFGLALAASPACDCGEPSVVDDAGSAMADASSDAAVLDAAEHDAVLADSDSFDTLTPDSGLGDSAAADTGPGDRGSADRSAADAASSDAVPAADSGADAATAADAAGSSDASPEDGGLVSDSGSAVDAGDAGASTVDAGPQVPDCSSGGLCISLTWSTASGDLDLHLSKDGAAWCSDEAAFWGNAKVGAVTPVDWDGTPGPSAGDPTVYGDATIGLGPEVLLIDTPPDGVYALGVFYNPGLSLGDSVATVKIHSDGSAIKTEQRSLSPDQFWQLGTVTVTAGAASVSVSPRICSTGVWICQDAVDACPPG